MNLYQIDEAIEKLLTKEVIDPETGEILDEIGYVELNELAISRDIKIENTACFIKNLEAEIAAIKAEEDALKKRRASKESKARWLRMYLTGYLENEGTDKFETARCKLSFRKSNKVEIKNEKTIPRKFKIQKTETVIDKREIGIALKAGEKVRGAELISANNLQIK